MRYCADRYSQEFILFETVVATEKRSLESIMKKMVWVINR